MSEPITIVHWGDQPYAGCAVRAALHHGRTVLLGTHAFGLGEEFVPLEDLRPACADRLGRFKLVGMAEWRLAFERRCFDRWVYLREWMLRTGTERVLAIDSDVLLVDDPRRTWVAAGAASTKDQAIGMWACTTVWLPLTLLDRVCERFLREHAATGGGWPVNDMVAFDAEAREGGVADWSLPWLGHAVDHNVHTTHGWQVDPATKDKLIRWEGRKPIATTAGGEPVRLCTLHLWSDRKEQMLDLYKEAYAD